MVHKGTSQVSVHCSVVCSGKVGSNYYYAIIENTKHFSSVIKMLNTL